MHNDAKTIVNLKIEKTKETTTIPHYLFDDVAFVFECYDEKCYIVIKDLCVYAYRDSDSFPKVFCDFTEQVFEDISLIEIIDFLA